MARVLVGRGEELRALVSAATNPPSAVFLAGEAGVGKTRLITELATDSHLPSRWWAIGRCQPMRFPYGAVLDALRTFATRPVRLSPVAGVLRPYLPELAEQLPPEPGRVADPVAERHRLFRAMRELLGAFGPGVLIIEDLHWADEGTRALLRFLLSDPPPGLALVLTYREEDLSDRGGPLGGASRPAPEMTTVRLRLDPLGATGVRRLAAEILGSEPVSQGFAAALHEHTAGIPFVVEEVLATLDGPAEIMHASAAMARSLLDELDPPAVLREAMIERLGALSPDATLLSEVAAVVGVPVASTLLGEIARLGRDRTRAGLIEALAGGVLVEVDGGRYGFRHPAGTRALYESLPGPHRQDLHTRAMRALRKEQPLPLLRLAEHSRRAGRVEDWLTYGEAAADNAATTGDAATAIVLLQRLLTEPSLRSSDVDRLATKFGWVAYAGLEPTGPAVALERLMATHRTSEEIRGELRLGLGLLLHRQRGGPVASKVELELAAAELRPQPALAARAMAVLAEPYVGTTPLAETTAWMRRVEESIRLCDRPWRTTLLATILASRLHVGDHAVWQDIPQLPVRVDTVEEQRQLARAHCNLADACSWTGHYEKARTFLSTGMRLANDCGAAYILSTAKSTEVHLDWLTGNWSGLAERATALLESHTDLLAITTEQSLILGSLAVAQGEWEQAERHLTATNLSTPDNAITPVVMAAHGMLITLRLATEDLDGATAAADKAMQLLRHKGVWAWAGEIAPAVTTAYLRTGRRGDAAAVVTELESAVAGIDAPMAHTALHVCAAELAHARGDPTAARAGFERARAGCAQLPRPYLATQLAERITVDRLDLGDPDPDPDAGERLAALAEEFDRLGATRDAARCRHLARRHGTVQHSRRGRRGYGDELSPREHDVARLLAGGRTNREIAEVLFLSRRTVEQHVANVLHKLGVHSRRELLDLDIK
jgi:DNA-binding CsgD family transcriptional regulator